MYDFILNKIDLNNIFGAEQACFTTHFTTSSLPHD